MGVVRFIRLLFINAIGAFWFFILSIQIVRLAITKRGKFFYRKNRKTQPACLTDPALGEHQNIQLKDVRLHYVESGPKDGPLMVLLHGFPEFWYSWRHQIRAFNRNYRVVAVDLRGYGGSSKPQRVDLYQVKYLVDDISELIQKLGNGKPCYVLGHDWGGAVTWSLAARYPNLVDKVVIMNCPHMTAMMKYMGTSWKQFMKSWYMFLVNLPYLPEWYFGTGDLKMLENAFTGKIMGAKPGAFTQEDLEAFKFTFNKSSDFTGPMNYIRAAIRGLNKPRETGGKVTGPPVLLVWGTKDGALNNEMARLSEEYAERFTLEFVEGASHWVQQDEPDVVNRLVARFLSE